MATFTNRATLSYNDNTTTSNIVTGEITETLVATKTALRQCYYNESEITYVISLINSGATTLTDLTVIDNLGAYEFNGETLRPLSYVDDSIAYFINGDLQAAPSVDDGSNLVITGITLPPSSSGIIIYTVEVNEYAPLFNPSSITNSATIIGDCLSNTVTATETIMACVEPRLEITKALSPLVVSDNGQITYTLNILNYGNTPATADDNIIVSDTFNPILNPINVTLNGTVLVANTDYTYNVTTGEFATTQGRITVPEATFTQDEETGAYSIVPGSVTLIITGTI